MAINGETIWITGASSGIGKALVEALAPNNQLIITARNEAALKGLQEKWSSIRILPADLSQKSSTALMKSQLESFSDHLDRVILNAGNCEYSDPANPNWSSYENLLSVNLLGQVHCIEASIELLKKAHAPHLVGVSSLAVRVPFPRAGAYGASKAAASYMFDSLRMDLDQFGIEVTTIYPGFVDTPLTQKNQFDMPFLLTSEEAAKRMVTAMEKRPFNFSFPKRLDYLLRTLNLFPKWWLRKNGDKSASLDQQFASNR